MLNTPMALAAGLVIGLALSWFWLWRPAVAMVSREKREAADKIARAERRVAELESEKTTPKGKSGGGKNKVADKPAAAKGDTNGRVSALESELAKERRERGELEEQHAKLQAQLESSGTKLANLQTEANRLRSASKNSPDGSNDESAAMAALRAELDEARRHARDLEAKLESQPAAPQVNVDDLKQVKGIGKAIERRLKHLGIKNLNQLAAMSAEEVEKIDNELDFRGRMTREDWSGQAKALITPS